jgi:selenocysteine lyase/cysteine desulfurase
MEGVDYLIGTTHKTVYGINGVAVLLVKSADADVK